MLSYLMLQTQCNTYRKRPNLLVFLDVTPEECKARIDKRGRKGDSGITIEYLKSLQEGYEEFVTEMSRILPVIKIKNGERYSAEDIAKIIVRSGNCPNICINLQAYQ